MNPRGGYPPDGFQDRCFQPDSATPPQKFHAIVLSIIYHCAVVLSNRTEVAAKNAGHLLSFSDYKNNCLNIATYISFDLKYADLKNSVELISPKSKLKIKPITIRFIK